MMTSLCYCFSTEATTAIMCDTHWPGNKAPLNMSRISSMTVGLVLIFLGSQLYLVKSYLLTPTATQFVSEHFSSNKDSQFASPVLTNSGGLLNGNNPQTFNNPWGSGGTGNTIGGSSGWTGGNSGNGIISSAPAGQKWPYYRTDNAGFNGIGNVGIAQGGNGSLNPFSNSSYQNPIGGISASNVATFGTSKRFVPPQWIMWPALFLGTVLFLHGAALRG